MTSPPNRAAPADQTLSSQQREDAIVQKILARLIPFLAILYVFCLLDRTNVSIAALTMKGDLGFSDRIYGLGAGIFFIGYFLFEVPSNLIMERVGARLWIARIMVTWGAISAAMMFVKTPSSFYAMRFLLGLAEAGFYPGVMLYLTYWVPSTSRARVIARFLALTAILGLFGGPVSGELLTLDGKMGLQGWQWLFLLEGIPSVLLGVLVFRIMPDSPNHASWLTAEEKEWLAARIQSEAHSQERVQHVSWGALLSDPRIVLLCLIFIITSTGGNAVGFFGPQLVKSLSGGAWSDTLISYLLTIPSIVGAIAISLAAGHSDRTGRRRLHITLGYFIAGLGFLLSANVTVAWGVLLTLSLNTFGERIAAGSYWAVATNLLGARAAAGGIAFINSVGNLGGFIGPFLMGELKQRSGGAYEPGLYTATALLMVASALAFLFLRNAPSSSAPPK